MTVILPTLIIILLYINASIVHIYRLQQKLRVDDLLAPNRDFREKARAAIALLWECHGWIWHGYEVIGLENIPANSKALVVYYHGPIPIDYYYLNSRYLIHNKRLMWTIAATFLFKTPGLSLLMEVIQATPGSVQQIANLLMKGEVVSVAPGGIREAQFSTEFYDLVWNGHLGFAKAACLGQAPIVPVFTENIREAFRTAPFGRTFFRWLYEKTKLPLLPLYGGFPVKLRTYVGEPIPFDPKASPEEMAERTAAAVQELVKKHQLVPGSIVKAMLQRFER